MTSKESAGSKGKPKSARKTVVKKKPAKKVVAKKTTVKKKAAAKKPKITPRQRYEMIATMAYYRAEHRNFEPGYEQEDWYESEQMVDRMLNTK